MIATVLGLVIAIPLLFANALLNRCREASSRSSTSRAPACWRRASRSSAVLEQIPAHSRRRRRCRTTAGRASIWIFASGVLMWTLIIERYWYFAMRVAEAGGGVAGASGRRARTALRGARGRSARR